MKKKELKSLAKRIAKAELIVQNSSDKKEISQAKQEIMELSSHAISLDDIMLLDEMIQEILLQNNS